MGLDKGNWIRDSVCDLFPILKERFHQKAGTLSGGQQQMLSIARILATQISESLTNRWRK